MKSMVMTEQEEDNFFALLVTMSNDELAADAALYAGRAAAIAPYWINEDSDMGTRDSVAESILWDIDHFFCVMEVLYLNRCSESI